MTVASTPETREHSPHDISSRDFWSRPFAVRDETFAKLRATDGVTWHAPLPTIFDKVEPGFWAITRRADICHVSQHPELFTSTQGVALDPMPAELQQIATFFLMMDPPQHTVYRRLISSAFTPRNVRRIEEQIHANAVAIVDDLIGAGNIDFVKACSARLPMLTICDMLGVPRSDHEAVAAAAEKLFSMSDDEYSSLEERAADTVNEMLLLSNTGIELAKFRRKNPGDDLMTSIVNAEVDGHRLTDEEIGAFMILLSSAGNDTTKQTTTHALMALAAHPEQRDWLMADFDNRIGPAIEEFVRYATPVLQFARFATADTEIAGQPIKAGDKLGLFYCSANRDESVFDDPHAFNLQRMPNPHVGFGGGGPHFCLGNQLAKSELRNLFRELLTRLRTIEFGEPEYLLSSFVHGIKRVPAYVQ
ncbi:cytochrome P450 [Mycolicibacterium thermoresistibile]|jgi:cytochrome P450|uniref:Steroid C26-monooxygenase n=2 Tax=Mycolicibacterium thermoresistibile TaxID=1797 RepID=G7CKM1_MYCT3|nr:cytochrome P450 [Mycolicibacterium thermoresistibile]EHI12928.1 NikQ protein [Mycolicibacterium thermoresistibile ATCC 19527]MCV7188068.1 cytochrome P450 [Mycolicibacterium thermoresistibile]GAT17275.1 cytochrome P450 124 cyp124 [Mycolicibacterium thermoresistibile]SNW17839.1 cytochrome P450 124 cyp124 [Mycolicibacterium thermoresistibile]